MRVLIVQRLIIGLLVDRTIQRDDLVQTDVLREAERDLLHVHHRCLHFVIDRLLPPAFRVDFDLDVLARDRLQTVARNDVLI